MNAINTAIEYSQKRYVELCSTDRYLAKAYGNILNRVTGIRYTTNDSAQVIEFLKKRLADESAEPDGRYYRSAADVLKHLESSYA